MNQQAELAWLAAFGRRQDAELSASRRHTLLGHRDRRGWVASIESTPKVYSRTINASTRRVGYLADDEGGSPEIDARNASAAARHEQDRHRHE